LSNEENEKQNGKDRNMTKLRMLPWVLGCAGVLGLIGCGDDGASTADAAVTAGTGGSVDAASVPDGAVAGTGGTGGATPDGGAPADGAAGTGGGADGAPVTACKNEMKPIMGDITTNTTWECNTYVLAGRTHIRMGATLTIMPGAKIFGDGDAGNPAALISTREGKLIAVGTKEQPIVFTSITPPGMRMPGDTFAGVALMGKATINNGSCKGDPNPATPACEAPGFLENVIEGLPATDVNALYGGTDDAHNCGELKYVRVEFAGFIIGGDNELNGITVAGCGTGTKLSYLHVHRGFDDGVEFFGGTASVDHLLITAPTDDGLDFDEGWRGNAQFVIIHQGYGVGDKGIEADNLGPKEDALPRTKPNLWNFTMIGRMGTTIGMHLREGMLGSLRNFIVTDFGGGAVDVDAKMVMIGMEWPANLSIENSAFFGGPLAKDETAMNNDFGFDEAAAIMDPARKNVVGMDPMLGNKAIGTPNYVPANAALNNQATPPAGMDTTANYAGAVKPGDTAPWYAGWTEFPEK
jgi:hypothetical protein